MMRETRLPRSAEDQRTILSELDEILASTLFSASSRYPSLLKYVVEKNLKGEFADLKERTIGVEVFHRHPDYDTNADPVVRSCAGEVRRRLAQFYQSADRNPRIVIELPVGGYVPEFHWETPVVATLTQDLTTSTVPLPELVRSVGEPLPRREHQLRIWIPLGVFILALAVLCLVQELRLRSIDHALYGWKYSPSVASLWSDFFAASPSTDIVIGDSALILVQNLSGETVSFNDYLSRNYVNQVSRATTNPELRQAISLISKRDLANPGDVRLAQRILALDPLSNHLHLYTSRQYMPTMIKQDNVILIGSRFSNPSEELFESQLTFAVETEASGTATVTNRSPTAGEPATYKTTPTTGYCVIAYLPNPQHKGKVLLIEGTVAEATEAAGDFLLSEDQFAAFRRQLPPGKLSYFEVLLKTSELTATGTPITASVVSYRIHAADH
jgi:hypothetical protein